MLQVLILSIVGVLLLWYGRGLYLRLTAKGSYGASAGPDRLPPRSEGTPGAAKTCPICSVRLLNGERVKSSAFPSMDGKDRLMYIYGCPYCLDQQRPRKRVCPVCETVLGMDDYLVARMFDRPGRSHVHVMGCSFCRKTGATRR